MGHSFVSFNVRCLMLVAGMILLPRNVICYEPLGLIMTTNCAARLEEALTFPAEYRVSAANCDEVSEFNAIAQLYISNQYRVIILIVSFSANCRAVDIAAQRVRQPTILFLIGCEMNTRQLTGHLSQLIVIQMSVPSWYPARIFEHIASHYPSGQRAVLVASKTCSDISSSILRDGSKFIAQYTTLDIGLQNIQNDYSRSFICLGLEDLNSQYSLNPSDSLHTTIFFKDPVGKTDLANAIEGSWLMDLFSSNHSLSFVPPFVVSCAMVGDSSVDHVATDLEKSLLLSNVLLTRISDVLSPEADHRSEISFILSSHRHTAKFFRVASSFVQLYDWTCDLIQVTVNGTIFTEKLRVSVDYPSQNISLPNDTANYRKAVSDLGFVFNDLSDFRWEELQVDNTANETAHLTLYLAVGISASVLVVAALILVAVYRQRYVKTTLSKDRVKFFIDADDLTAISKRTNTSLSITSTNNSKNGGVSNGHVHHDVGRSYASVKTADSEADTELGLAAGDNYFKFGGEVVFLRHIRTKHISLKKGTRRMVNIMRDLRADNLNGFVAYFIGHAAPFRPPAVVFEYCPRGSLMDLIDKEEIKLDWSFKVSFLGDIVRGLRAIHHSPLKFHGRLTSRKCVIDNRWTLKITDYAVYRLESLQNGEKPDEEHVVPEGQLWTAPEVLRNQLLVEGTAKGDIYSFAIIMQELILRGRPFCTTDLSAQEIIQKVRHPPPLLRPQVPRESGQPEALAIMKECWNENPEIRPSIDDVVIKFKALNQGRKTNIVDSMFQMLEKYSNNLEELIHERTEELNEEKKKTEQLLYRMMPQSVAEKLKVGQAVEPENFAEVTIYFSDIVGFTTISAYSSPMEIVNLLNDLYSVFDTTLSYYDVYKVETIGDAYMVVSGLPIANGNRHSAEIASVALDLLYQCGKFRIRHLFEVPLMLRIGIHTGSCAAGVVGLTMPRYCLFGDTVNTASRMESTSRAYRIHLSDTTYQKLTAIGGFRMDFRGMTLVKGKGELPTYWLEGKEGFHKPLPPPAPDTGENHGLSEAVIIRGRELQNEIDSKNGLVMDSNTRS